MYDYSERISIISPVYNVEAYLDEFIQSVIAQTYTDWRLYLVNDGSTDSSGQIIEKYAEAESRITVINKQNGGISSARNAALRVVSGEFIAFADSDDILMPDYLKTLYEVIEREKSDICCCEFKSLFVGAEIDDHRFPSEIINMSGTAFLCNLYIYPLVYSVVWNRLYRRNVWEGLMFPEGIICEDTYIAISLLENVQKITCIPNALYGYRQRGSGTTGSKSEKYRNAQNECFRYHVEVWKQKGNVDLEYRARKELYYCLVENYIYSDRGTRKKYKREIRQLKKIMLSGHHYSTKIIVKIYVLRYFTLAYSWLYHKRRKTKYELYA